MENILNYIDNICILKNSGKFINVKDHTMPETSIEGFKENYNNSDILNYIGNSSNKIEVLLNIIKNNKYNVDTGFIMSILINIMLVKNDNNYMLTLYKNNSYKSSPYFKEISQTNPNKIILNYLYIPIYKDLIKYNAPKIKSNVYNGMHLLCLGKITNIPPNLQPLICDTTQNTDDLLYIYYTGNEKVNNNDNYIFTISNFDTLSDFINIKVTNNINALNSGTVIQQTLFKMTMCIIKKYEDVKTNPKLPVFDDSFTRYFNIDTTLIPINSEHNTLNENYENNTNKQQVRKFCWNKKDFFEKKIIN